jgi:hypothetical protein
VAIRHDEVDAAVSFAIRVMAGKQGLETPSGEVWSCGNEVDIGNPRRDKLVVLS